MKASGQKCRDSMILPISTAFDMQPVGVKIITRCNAGAEPHSSGERRLMQTSFGIEGRSISKQGYHVYP